MSRLSARTCPRRAASWLLPALLLVAVQVRGGDLGPHGGLASGDGNDCRACHPGYPDTGIGGRLLLPVPRGGQERLGEPTARFCWMCHRPGNPYGARTAEQAFGAPSHLRYPGATNAPDSWLGTMAIREGASAAASGFSRSATFTCTTCHDVHDHAAPFFLRQTTPDGDFSLLCDGCHPGRENPGLVGRDNIMVRDRLPYATHPTSRCGSCHEAHQAPGKEGLRAPGLLRLGAGETVADLCRRCHVFPDAEDTTAHPMEGRAGRGPYPRSFASAAGIPRDWSAAKHFDAGATGMNTAAKEPPRCTSCHDLHGGLPMTSLLYGPVPAVSGGSGEWCFSCHAAADLLPADHEERAAGSAGRACSDCHGAVSEGGAAWPAHRGFRTVRSPGAPLSQVGSSSAAAAPPGDRQQQEIVERLARTLRDDRPLARENAARALVKLKSPLALAAVLEAVGDPRPDVREKGALVLGAIGDARAVPLLVGLLGNPEAETRRTAVEALGKLGGEQATLALLPLLRDPALAVRRAAVSALAGVRDPRVYPDLTDVMWDSDIDLRLQAQDVLARMNDARVLRHLLDDDKRRPVHVTALIAVMNRLDDPAGTAPLLEALRYNQRLVRIAAAEALRSYPDPAVADALVAALDSPDGRFRATVVSSLGLLRNRRGVEPLLAILANPDETEVMRRAAIVALSRIAPPETVLPLIAALGDPSPAMQEEAIRALALLTCQNFGQEQARWREWWARNDTAFPLGHCRSQTSPLR